MQVDPILWVWCLIFLEGFQKLCGKIKFLFCHPSSSLRTKKISVCAQGGLVAKSVKRFPVNLRIRVRFQLNSTHPCHPPSTFSIADSSAKQNSDEKFLLSLSSVSMDDICNQFKFLVG